MVSGANQDSREVGDEAYFVWIEAVSAGHRISEYSSD
jgi:hypothetical protein